MYFSAALLTGQATVRLPHPPSDGTSYNAYLVKGSEKTVLIDTVDPSAADGLMEQLKDVEKLDYVIATTPSRTILALFLLCSQNIRQQS